MRDVRPNMSLRARRAMMIATAAGVSIALGWSSSGTAVAGELHPSVTSPIPSPDTPHLVSDAQVVQPTVHAITRIGDTMYAGGDFTTVSSPDRNTEYARTNLMAFDASTGAVRDLSIDLDGIVWGLATDGSRLWAGGEFSTVNGTVRPAVAQLDPVTGAVVDTFRPPLRNGRVTDLDYNNGQLFMAGNFPRKLASVNPTTGKYTPLLKQTSITGKLPNSSGNTNVSRISVDPSGSRLVAIGNFTTVDGEPRSRAFMLDLTGTEAVLDPWYYAPLNDRCRSTTPSKIAYLTGVDFAPDGSWFVLGSTGFVTESTSQIGTHLCDVVARFETEVKAPIVPTWINHTGGDTVQSVAATGAAVYAQGHFRWMDNPQGRDSAGPGSVERRGVAALDPTTGKAIDSWAPQAPARRGGFAIFTDSTGVWFGADSTRFGGHPHRGLAYTPLP